MLKVVLGYLLGFFIIFFIFSFSYKKEIFSDLTKEEINQFHEKGFIIIRGLLTKKEIEIVKKAMEDFREASKTLGVGQHMLNGAKFTLKSSGKEIQVKRIAWAGAMKPELVEIGRKKAITSIVSSLLGALKADHLVNQLHPKDPKDKEFGWHQDVENRMKFDPLWEDINGKGSYVQVITAIDMMSKNNGAIRYLPLDPKHKSNLNLREKTTQELNDIIGEEKNIHYFELQPGDTIFMSPYLIHGSGINNSKESRLIFINGFAIEGANKKPYPGEGSGKIIEL